MKREEIQRLRHLKEYLDGWNWELEPWFTLPKEDSEPVRKVLNQYFRILERERRQKEKKRGGHL